MKIPRFELVRVHEDGTREEPRIVPVTGLPWDVETDRRGFLGAAIMAGVALMPSADAEAKPPKPPRGAAAKKKEDVPPAAASDPCKNSRAHKNYIGDLVISPDGKRLVSIALNDAAIKLWRLPDGALVKTLDGHRKGRVEYVAISPDGKWLASGGDDSLKLWGLPDGAPVKILRNFSAECVAFSPDGKLLADGTGNGRINLWSLPDGALMKTLKAHESNVYSVAIGPDGKLLASGGEDKAVKLWSLPDGAPMDSLKAPGNETGFVAITPDGKLLMARDGGHNVRLWSLQPRTRLWGLWTDHELLATFQAQGGRQIFAIAPDGKLLAAGDLAVPTDIELWRLPDGASVKRLEGHKKSLRSLAIAPDGKLLASGSVDNTIRLWRLPDGQPLGTLEGHDRPVGVVAISPDGKLLASGDDGGSIRLWSLPDGKPIACLIDLDASPEQAKGATHTVKDAVTGQIVTYTLPCGSPIPPGATCTCNCVPGSIKPPVVPRSGGGSGYSRSTTSRTICVCMAVRCR
ncbi:MAG: WD40 repeat domain-containing protein [Candidatus Accumulibacter sp.]|nr:WD40 repeat domain-containing protein [Accumulibacter sp.]